MAFRLLCPAAGETAMNNTVRASTMTNRLSPANLVAQVDAGMPASICSGKSASTRTGPAEMLATEATFDSRREP